MGSKPHRGDCLTADDAVGFIEGWLGADARARAETHISHCPECRMHVSALVKSSRASGPAAPREAFDGTMPAGTRVGRYVLGPSIGRGAMGVVYEAHDPELDRKIALKMMRSFSTENLSPDRLQSEARAMARIRHSNVVAVHDIGVHQGQLFIAMEFVEGSTLRDWLRRESRSAREILDAFLQAGRGVAAVHAAGIVHRDFKPENVLREPSGHVRVSDLGLARETSAVDETRGGGRGCDVPPITSGSLRSLAGTPTYMAPEQHAGRPPDAASDQFSFCVALYEALYGSHPFGPEGWRALVEEGAQASARRPARNERARVPWRARRALMRGLQVEPSGRHPSMEALLLALSPPASKWWIGVGLAVAVFAVLSVPLVQRRARATSLRACEASGIGVAEIWNEARRRAVGQAILATNKPFSERVWQEVLRGLDAYAKSLGAAQTQACEAAEGRSEPATLLELRLGCLDERKMEMAALVELLLGADAVVVSKAVDAIDVLPSIEICNEPKRLLLQPKPAIDAAAAKRVALVRSELARVRALAAAGKYGDGLHLAETALREAEAIDYRPLHGEALFLHGHMQGVTGKTKDAEQTLQKAIVVADSVGDDATRARALADLLFDVNESSPETPDRAAILNEQLAAAVTRMGGSRELEALRHLYYGNALRRERKLDPAQAEIETALRLLETDTGTVSLRRVIGCLTALGFIQSERADLGAATNYHRRAFAMSEARLGPSHPQVATQLNGLGEVLRNQLRFGEAADHFRRAIHIIEEGIGPDSPVLTATLVNLGYALNDLGRHGEALAALERARAIQLRVAPESPFAWYPLVGLGEAYLGVGDRRQAIVHLERAILSHRERGHAADLGRARLTLAIALWPDAHARARDLVIEARDGYRQTATSSPLDARNATRVEQWIREHPIK